MESFFLKLSKKSISLINLDLHDLKNGGEGKLDFNLYTTTLKKIKHKIKPTVIFLNIGGIANILINKSKSD